MTPRQSGDSSGSAGNQSANLLEEKRDSFYRDVPATKPSPSLINRLSGLTISFDNPHLTTTHLSPTLCSGKRTPHFQEQQKSLKPSSVRPPGKKFAQPACCSYECLPCRNDAVENKNGRSGNPIAKWPSLTETEDWKLSTVCPDRYWVGLESGRLDRAILGAS